MPQPADIFRAYRICDQIARRRARNFYPAFRFLPKERRMALSAFYTFCALSDDIVDSQPEFSSAKKVEALKQWRRSLEECFSGEADQPVFVALGDAVRRFRLPPEPFFDLLDGIGMDLEHRRYDTFEELKLYCLRVASSVGLISVRIFGCHRGEADQYAERLGIAFQLTNILRDIPEDLGRDRIYLPQEDLRAFSYSESDLKRKIYDHRFREMMNRQYLRTVDYFRMADLNLVGSGAKRLLAAEIMRSVYRGTLEEIRRRNFNVFEQRIVLPKWRLAVGIARTVGKHILR